MSDIRWNFPVHQEGYMLQDPFQAEFFTAESVGGLSYAIVREAVQNALDARLKGTTPVGVQFDLVSVVASRYAQYFDGLSPHLQTGLPDQDVVPSFQEPMRFLIIEDFNTKGLVGDYTVRVEKDAKENNFFYFWRNVGRSGKSGDHRGRWGLGKSVFAVVSGINTFFGITVRHRGEHELLLMGQSVLRHHQRNDGTAAYTPYGHYGEFDTTHPNFALPIRDNRRTKDFCTTFKLHRVTQDQKSGKPQVFPGLSIVIPLPDEEITDGTLIQAVIDQYFYPILDKSLYIEIAKSFLRRDRLVDEISRIFADEDERRRYRNLIAFTDWAISLPDDALITLREPPNPTAAPTWNYDYLTEDELHQVRSQFQETGRCAFRVPIKVQEAKKDPDMTTFMVYVERDDSIIRAENYFIREGITITGVRTMTQRGLRGMVVIDKQPLTTMLGDAENPAHTEWHKDSLKFKGKYLHGASTLSFVKNSLKVLAAQLTTATKEIDRDLLRDIFALPSRNKPRRGKTDGGKASKTEDENKMPDLEPRKTPVALHQLHDGVVIAADVDDEAVPQRITAEFAYDVRSGDPFRRYVPADFDLSNGVITIDSTGVDVQVCQANRLEFTVQSAPFEVRVTGFDRYRDLKVRLKWGELEA